ncbi:sigma-54-dependent Fis family transcriptional regulator [Marinobacter sp. HL-58]|uniref:sigma-54-dependent Fis family transcriptional regulator n=1 Tax=Marinobacter sp. HL-58 TaxID=1479237 RepID=UPI0004837A6A|nr:sigma-54-dependent Fis family transcriptional regulator [Marinobacter sp. HL-58]KPQ00048.1 MAG: Transcriptional activator of acetoin/glycerol metabolism [Marinobacter sp. HL-58]
MTMQLAKRRHIDAVLSFTDDHSSSTLPPGSELIGRSWKRCINEYGLDPSQPRSARIVTQQTLREHQDSVDEFLNVARAGVEQLYMNIANLGYVLLLTDHRGITVQYLGDRRHDQRLRKAGLYLGADWSEQYAGTCAVGTCIQEQQPLTCHRVDHFDASHISLTCTAAPILDPLGNLLAVLDISALDSPDPRSSQTFALHLTQLYARMIEDAYFLRRYRNQTIFRCDASREFVQVNGQFLFAIDDDGCVEAANTAGRSLMESTGADKGAAPGPDITSLFECELRDIWSIPYDHDDQVKAFRHCHTGNTYFAALILPRVRSSAAPSSEALSADESVPELDSLAADDPVMRRTLGLAKRLRNRDVGLLIRGETGTGKEVLARAIHDSSHRSRRAFVAVNCAAIPESLIESELFGYVAGAFTGARAKGMRGMIQQADGGTLFLDEIGDMPLQLQTRLLRVLAEGEILPVGADRPVKVNCRVIAATHQDLGQLIESGGFRADLYYRLNGATLRLPSLGERADRQHVINRVLKNLIARGELPDVRIRADAMSALLAYDWPGNIRQLVNALAFAEATCDNGQITVNDLPEECLCNHATTSADSASVAEHEDGNPFLAALIKHQWNVSEVARAYGVSRPTIYRWMHQQNIEPPRFLGKK